jgi:hypothetical protein
MVADNYLERQRNQHLEKLCSQLVYKASTGASEAELRELAHNVRELARLYRRRIEIALPNLNILEEN